MPPPKTAHSLSVAARRAARDRDAGRRRRCSDDDVEPDEDEDEREEHREAEPDEVELAREEEPAEPDEDRRPAKIVARHEPQEADRDEDERPVPPDLAHLDEPEVRGREEEASGDEEQPDEQASVSGRGGVSRGVGSMSASTRKLRRRGAFGPREFGERTAGAGERGAAGVQRAAAAGDGGADRLVPEVRREPALRLLDGDALAAGVVVDLVAADPPDREVVRLGCAK